MPQLIPLKSPGLPTYDPWVVHHQVVVRQSRVAVLEMFWVNHDRVIVQLSNFDSVMVLLPEDATSELSGWRCGDDARKSKPELGAGIVI